MGSRSSLFCVFLVNANLLLLPCAFTNFMESFLLLFMTSKTLRSSSSAKFVSLYSTGSTGLGFLIYLLKASSYSACVISSYKMSLYSISSMEGKTVFIFEAFYLQAKRTISVRCFRIFAMLTFSEEVKSHLLLLISSFFSIRLSLSLGCE